MQIRSTIFLSGRVQGVGMRFAVYQIAQNRKVVGTVENLEDGRVKVVAEAESEEMDRFEADIRSISTGKIQKIERFDSDASLEFDRFSVTR